MIYYMPTTQQTKDSRIISYGSMIRIQEPRAFFEDTKCAGAGYSFASDEDGNILRPLTEIQSGSLAVAMDRTRYADPAVVYHHIKYWDPLVVRCACGRELDCPSFTNTCYCGADYNSSGQRLADRSQWGEETGESLADVLNVR